jgi:hypothetical protein
MKLQFSTAVLSLCAGLASLLGSSMALAQSASFTHIAGTSCPGGFTQGGGFCTDKNGTKEGMVANGKSCPSGFIYSSPYCYRKIKKEKESSKSSSSSSSSSAPPSADQTFAYLAITARVAKASETDMCPTGYFSNRQNLAECVTHYADAPKSRIATGGKCSAGETLERGKYCTGPTTMSAKDMDNAVTYDFNDLYTLLSAKRVNTSGLATTPPEVAAPMIAKLKAERDAERAKDDARTAEANRKFQAEVDAKNNHRDEQVRVMCAQVRASGMPIGPDHSCHGVPAPSGTASAATATQGNSPSAATPAPVGTAPAATAQDAVKQEAGKLLKGLLGR